jgi:hypothetical protein
MVPSDHACASRFIRGIQDTLRIVDCVALLLDRGADPNSFTLADPSEPDIKIPAAARAQANFNPPVELLRQRGAEFVPCQSRSNVECVAVAVSEPCCLSR